MSGDVAFPRVILEGLLLIAPGAERSAVQHPDIVVTERLAAYRTARVRIDRPPAAGTNEHF